MIVLVGLIGCGKSKEESIVGKWQEVGGNQSMEFFKDGTVIAIEEGLSLTGKYEFINDNQFKMEFKDFGELLGTIIAQMSDSGDEFSLTALRKIEKYRRLQDKTEVKKIKAQVHPKRISGKYVDKSDSDKYLELKNDGTFASSNPPYPFGSQFVGEWRVVTIISFAFDFDRDELTENDLIEGEIVGDTLLTSGRSTGRWCDKIVRKNITPWDKKRNALLIETVNQGNSIWSMYSNEDWLFEFQLKKNKTFSISAKGIWDIRGSMVRLHDAARNEKTFFVEMSQHGNLVFISYPLATILEKQNGAYIIEKTKGRGTLWSRYVRGEQNIVLEFDKSGSFRMTGGGIWRTYTGLICRDNCRQWKAIVRDGALIDHYDQVWAKQ